MSAADECVAVLGAFLRERRDLSASAQDVPTPTGCRVDYDTDCITVDVDHADDDELATALTFAMRALMEGRVRRLEAV